MPPATPPRWRTSTSDRSPVVGVAAAVAVALVLGAVTAWAQGVLPDAVAPLANSAGSWSLVAWLLAMRAARVRVAVPTGALVLAGLLVGYVALNAARDVPSGTGLLLFWGAAALLVGPLLGLGGHWFRHRRDWRAALGAGGMAGVGVGEGAYGLRYLSETTSSAYWTGSLVAGLVLVAIAVVRLRDLRLVWVAASAVAIITGAFVLVYPRADQILALLS